MRRTGAIASAAGSLACFAASVAGAWATFDFWETVPLVPAVIGTGCLAGLAVYLFRAGRLAALVVFAAVAAATFVSTLLVTIARWEG